MNRIEEYEELLKVSRETSDKRGQREACVSLGFAYHSLGKYHEAIRYFKESLSIAVDIGDKKGEGAAYGNLGVVYQYLNDYQESIKYFDKLLGIAKEIGDQEGEAEARRNLGVSYGALGKHQEAICCFEKQLILATNISDRFGEGKAYWNLGTTYESLEKYQDAIKCHENFLSVAKAVGDRNGEGKVYWKLGAVYRLLGKYEKAIEYQEKFLGIALESGDEKSARKAHGTLGVLYYSLGKYQESLKHHKKCLSIDIELGDKDSEGTAHVNLGVVYKLLGKNLEALDHFEKSLSIAIKAGDKRDEENAYGHLGVVYQSLGKYKESIKYNEKKISIAKEIGDRKGEGTAYGDLGVAYNALANYQEAVKCHKKFLSIAKEIGFKNGEGTACGNLGAVYHSLGRYQEAIEYHEKSLGIAVKIDDKDGEGAAYGNLGVIYQAIGNYQLAGKYHRKHLSIAMEAGDKSSQGVAYGNLGVVYKSLGRYNEAISSQKEKLNVTKEIGDKEGEERAYGNLGTVYQILEDYENAIKCHEKCLSIAKEIGDKNGEGRSYGNLGVIYYSQGKYQESKLYQEKRLSIALEIGDKEGEGVSLNNLGFVFASLAKLYENELDQQNYVENEQKSASYFKEALKCYEWLFDHLEGHDQLKISIIDRFINTYQILTQVLINLKQIKEALLASERGRARALGDILVSRYGLSKGHESRINLITYNEVEALLPNNKRTIQFFMVDQNFVIFWRLTHQKPPLMRRKSVIRKLRAPVSRGNERKHVEASLVEAVEAAFEEMRITASVSCEDRSLDILEENDDTNNSRDDVDEPLLLPGPPRHIAREIYTKQENIRPQFMRPEEEGEPDPLKFLYNNLIATEQQDLAGDEIVVIPDGILFKVPFAALRDPVTNLYLTDTKRVRLAPSLTTLRALQETPVDLHSKTGALIVGNPAVEEVMIKGVKNSFIPLPGAELEAKEIGDLMGVAPLIGAKATKEAIKHRLQEGVAVVHIAAHGSMKGKILLAPCRPQRRVPEEEDCMLTMKEVQESGVRAQLVVLSCCHSGGGKIRAEGVVGLTRAFLAAGARAVVASLWAIDDDATKELMLRFYTHLKGGESGSASLQHAMKEVRKIPRYSEPRYWAAFFLIGDDVTIRPQDD